jgi:hypothetical protein
MEKLNIDEGQQDTLRKALISISKLRQDVGEKKFRELLLSLTASARNSKHASELARSFDEESGNFIRPYQRMMKIIGKDQIERRKFRRAVYNFKPKNKGQRGGLKQYAAELRQERDAIAEFLKDYHKLITRRLKQTDPKRKIREKMDKEIPKSIRELLLDTTVNIQGKVRPAYKEIAIEWMARCYPCTKNTLIQILRESSTYTDQQK